MVSLPGLTKDPTPPAVDTQVSPISIPDGTTLITTKGYNKIIDYLSGDAGPDFIPQNAIANLVADLANIGNTFARVVKKVDQIVNNSIVLQDDNEITVALNANKVYSGFIVFYIISPFGVNINYSFSIPTGATGEILAGVLTSSSPQQTALITGVFVGATNGTPQMLVIPFTVKTDVTPGALTLRWAQQTATPVDTLVRKGTLLEIYEELP